MTGVMCRCGHDRDAHDPIDDTFAGACGDCDCEGFTCPAVTG